MMGTPDPAKFSRRLSANARYALLTAYNGEDGLRVEQGMQEDARSFCLIDTRTPYLSAFGLKVRIALRDRRNAL